MSAEILWSNQLSQAADLAGSSGAGGLVSESGRGSVLHFSVTNTNESAVRSFPLPIERLRNRFVFLDAEVKAADVGPKPNSWNGIKVMMHLETPAGSQWPQAELTGAWWDKAAIERAIAPATAFVARYRVHLYVGEFSVIRWAPGGDKYLSDLIDIVESHGWDWSYHAFREWDGWSVEHGTDPKDHNPTAQPTARKLVLLKWLGQNKTELNHQDSGLKH